MSEGEGPTPGADVRRHQRRDGADDQDRDRTGQQQSLEDHAPAHLHISGAPGGRERQRRTAPREERLHRECEDGHEHGAQPGEGQGQQRVRGGDPVAGLLDHVGEPGPEVEGTSRRQLERRAPQPASLREQLVGVRVGHQLRVEREPRGQRSVAHQRVEGAARAGVDEDRPGDRGPDARLLVHRRGHQVGGVRLVPAVGVDDVDDRRHHQRCRVLGEAVPDVEVEAVGQRAGDRDADRAVPVVGRRQLAVDDADDPLPREVDGQPQVGGQRLVAGQRHGAGAGPHQPVRVADQSLQRLRQREAHVADGDVRGAVRSPDVRRGRALVEAEAAEAGEVELGRRRGVQRVAQLPVAEPGQRPRGDGHPGDGDGDEEDHEQRRPEAVGVVATQQPRVAQHRTAAHRSPTGPPVRRASTPTRHA